MSYILDALKKIEHEKSKKVHPDGRISISGDLFQERKRPESSAARWKIAALIVAASVVTCAGTWFVLRGGGKKSSAVIRPAAIAPLPVNPPIATAPVPAPVQPLPAPAVAPPAIPIAAAPVTKGRETAGDGETSAPVVRSSKKTTRTSPSTLPPKQSAQTVQAPADIKLSGIAWQDEHTARRAVINGFLLKEGAVISGARITDIQSDRVRFSSAAGLFEIKLDSVLPAEVQK